MNRIFPAVLIVLAIAAVSVAGTLAYLGYKEPAPAPEEVVEETSEETQSTETPLPPSELASYTHAQSGISFKYPKNWLAKELPPNYCPSPQSVGCYIGLVPENTVMGDYSIIIGTAAAPDIQHALELFIGDTNFEITKNMQGTNSKGSVVNEITVVRNGTTLRYYVVTPKTPGAYIVISVTDLTQPGYEDGVQDIVDTIK